MKFIISTINDRISNVLGRSIDIIEIEEMQEFGDTELTFVGEHELFVIIIDNDGLYLLEIRVDINKENNGIATSIIEILLDISKNNGFKRFGVLAIHNKKILSICDKLGILNSENGSDRMFYFNN